MLGHEGPPTAYWKENLVDGTKLERCPMRSLLLADPELVAEINRHVNEYFPFYEGGHLLVAGGISDQPARWVAYMLEINRDQQLVDLKFAELNAGGEGSE